ncbi:MAG: hypothetical protein HYX32_12820 [Actinobacteria bacterium]|nr:hypothetical protein [Actinomycetota bacterium]
MRVLVLESEPGLADDLVTELASSGHSIARCHERGEAPFPCKALASRGRCPLDEAPVEVAIAVDGSLHAASAPPPEHDGARCALRRTIPLVIAGPENTALAPWASRTVTSADTRTIVTAAEEAATAPLSRHADAALGALKTVLDIHGLENNDAVAEVVRERDELTVRLNPGVEVSQKLREVASIRALSAVREADPFAARIGVKVVG